MFASFLISMMDMVVIRRALKAHPNLRAPIFSSPHVSFGRYHYDSFTHLKMEHQGRLGGLVIEVSVFILDLFIFLTMSVAHHV